MATSCSVQLEMILKTHKQTDTFLFKNVNNYIEMQNKNKDQFTSMVEELAWGSTEQTQLFGSAEIIGCQV